MGQRAAGLQEKVHNLCQTLYDIMRTVLTLKYSYKIANQAPGAFAYGQSHHCEINHVLVLTLDMIYVDFRMVK